MTRQDGRAYDELRPIKITTDFVKFPEGSCLIECGDTKVLCCASIEEKTPPHVAEGEGWVTAEYSMLPRANRERSKRDISKLKLNGRSAEIQRLIGRSLRSVVDRKKLGPWNITIDCDVLQGDGGTRTASITGGFVAMMLAFQKMMEKGQLSEYPISGYVAAVSAGVVNDVPMLDLCYEEDSSAMVDLNCVMDDQGRLIEIQGTGEGRPFTLEEQQKLVEVTAVVHDIACPLCRVKYGNANGKHQEEESAALIEEFFVDSDLPKEFVDRVSYIVSHHHTITGIDGIDYQIMIEADYLVNADESNFSGNNVRNMLEKVFKTETGKFLLQSMYQKRLNAEE